MILPFVLFAAFIVITLLVLLYLLYPGSRRVTTIPGLDPSSEAKGNVPDITKAGTMTEFLIGLHDEFGPIASFWINKEFVVSLASPETHKEIAHLFDRPASLYMSFEPLLGKQSIQCRNGAEGQRIRKLHDRSFTQAKLSDKLPMIQEVCEGQCAKWAGMSGEQHIPLSVHMSAMVMKVLTRFAFGDYFKDETSLLSFKKNYDQCFCTMENTLIEGPMKPGSEKEVKFNQAIDRMKKVVEEIIAQREKAEIAPADKVFIDSLLDQYDNEDMVFDDVITYLVIGSHTTSFLLTWVFYMLAKYPDVQERLYKEIVASYKGGPVTVETLKNMKYLQNVMNETMRFVKLAPFAARVSNQECIIGGHKVPENTPLITSIGTLMADSRLWENPDEFNPDRFERKPPAYAFEPFGFAGKRKCPGYRMTELESQMLVVLAIKQFKVSLVAGQVVERKYGIVTKPAEEIWLLADKRK